MARDNIAECGTMKTSRKALEAPSGTNRNDPLGVIALAASKSSPYHRPAVK